MFRPCLDCGALTNETRCANCKRKWNVERRPTTKQRGYGAEWARYAKSRIAQEPWCVVCGATSDLTLDHANNAVMCRSCNSGRRWDKGLGGTRKS